MNISTNDSLPKMSRIDRLEKKVRSLYNAKDPNRNDWADWLAQNHVFVVANNASALAKRFNASQELARAAALLHDIADASMSRFTAGHEAASLEIARGLMSDCDFTNDEIALVVDDAIRFHSCYDGHVPTSIEGKILATADAQAHLNSDFYIYATWAMGNEKTLAELKPWVLKKIDRDFNNKILFPAIKAECRANYLALKDLYSR